MINYFKRYSSNTLAGSGNQCFFVSDCPKQVTTSRILYKIFSGGCHNYSFLFSNIIDSTFASGEKSRRNRILSPWTIHGIRVGITDSCDETSHREPAIMQTVTFDGRTEKTVHPGEFFATDPIALAPQKDEYLCLEISFSGSEIPNHEESIIPSFILKDGQWVPSKKHPFALQIGCDRRVEKRVAFFGDSITQGIGTPVNSYAHWNSVLAAQIGEQNAYWNLGLGYGRADDAATDSAWLYRAKQNDVVVVCFGVNDIMQGFSAESIWQNLSHIVDTLLKNGIRVVLQTVPPFDYQGERIAIWNEVNDYIKTELSKKVELVFDCAPLLAGDEPHLARYGGHPNAEGCKIWGDALAVALKQIV